MEEGLEDEEEVELCLCVSTCSINFNGSAESEDEMTRAAISEQIVKFPPQRVFCWPFASGLTTNEWGFGIPQLQHE